METDTVELITGTLICAEVNLVLYSQELEDFNKCAFSQVGIEGEAEV